MAHTTPIFIVIQEGMTLQAGIFQSVDIIDARRADLAAKYLLFRALDTGVGRRVAEDIYRRHILVRTGGMEPSSKYDVTAKTTVDSYVSSAEELYASMKKDGFRSNSPIPIGSNGLLRNGAHRLACASAIGSSVFIDFEREGGWPWDWHSIASFTDKNERLLLLRASFDLAPARSVPFVLYAPAMDRWDSIVSEINDVIPVQGYVDLAFPTTQRPAFNSLIYDLYSHGVGSLRTGMDFIDRKNEFLNEYPSFLRVGCALVSASDSGSYRGIVDELKRSLRLANSDRVPESKFITCHFADGPEEALHMAETLFNPDNLAVLRRRPVARPREYLLEWLDRYRQDVVGEKLAIDDCCIVGSTILETIGIRQSTDIDFTLRNEIRATSYGPGVTHLLGGTDMVTENYHRSREYRNYSDAEIIGTPGLHVMFRGLKIVSPWIVRDRKRYSARPKDTLDVELIDSEPLKWIEQLSEPWR